jgi:hypothetical protein
MKPNGAGTVVHVQFVEVLGVSVMTEGWMLAFGLTVPFLCLGLLMWLARLEETLGDGLESPKATLEPSLAAGPATPVVQEAAPATAAA